MTGRWGLRAAAFGYLGVVLILPVAYVFYKAFQHGITPAWHVVDSHDSRHALLLTVEIAAIAVPANAIFGVIAALFLVRRAGRLAAPLGAIIDLPLALSPIVVGLALLLVFRPTGWLGPFFLRHHVQILFALPSMVLATMLVSLPFVVREVAPVLREIGIEQEQAAWTLGATRLQTFLRITFPAIRSAVAYGVVLSMARSIGEFGGVSVVSGHIIGQTETLTLAVQDHFEQFDVHGSYALSVELALIAIVTLLAMGVLRPRHD